MQIGEKQFLYFSLIGWGGGGGKKPFNARSSFDYGCFLILTDMTSQVMCFSTRVLSSRVNNYKWQTLGIRMRVTPSESIPCADFQENTHHHSQNKSPRCTQWAKPKPAATTKKKPSVLKPRHFTNAYILLNLSAISLLHPFFLR